jgi:two-component system chemotaxis response regulator CheY
MSASGFDALRALVVEDNHHMRNLLRSLLFSMGLRKVTESASGADAIEILRDDEIDLVLTDLSMEPMDGIAFTKKVRLSDDSPNPYVPIIMVTGHTERWRVEAARDAGITEFIAKPITSQHVFTRVAEIIERPRAFIRSTDYFGPDRRRRSEDKYNGPLRRKCDFGMRVEIK